MHYSFLTRLIVGIVWGLALFGLACGTTILLNIPPGQWVSSALADQPQEPHWFPESSEPYVVSTERLWIGPNNADYVLVMVWSDGQIWSAHTDQIDLWEPLTTVKKD